MCIDVNFLIRSVLNVRCLVCWKNGISGILLDMLIEVYDLVFTIELLLSSPSAVTLKWNSETKIHIFHRVHKWFGKFGFEIKCIKISFSRTISHVSFFKPSILKSVRNISKKFRKIECCKFLIGRFTAEKWKLGNVCIWVFN